MNQISALLMILAAAFSLVAAFGSFMLRRNSRVYEFRTQLIAVIEPGTDDYWELSDEYTSVDYDTMMKRFWRPLPSFYRGTRLLAKYEQARPGS